MIRYPKLDRSLNQGYKLVHPECMAQIVLEVRAAKKCLVSVILQASSGKVGMQKQLQLEYRAALQDAQKQDDKNNAEQRPFAPPPTAGQ